MAKVAIENENITSFGGVYHIMDVFSKLGFERQRWQATDRYLRKTYSFLMWTYSVAKKRSKDFTL